VCAFNGFNIALHNAVDAQTAAKADIAHNNGARANQALDGLGF
jgi:hypothetical protein